MGTHPESLWRILTYISLGGATCLIVRLACLRIINSYPALAFWAIVSAMKAAELSMAAYYYPRNSPEYIGVWNWMVGITSLCLAISAVEVFRQTLTAYPNPSASYGRKVFAVSFTIALAISLLPFSVDTISRQWSNPTWVVGILVRTVSIAVPVGLFISTRHFKRVRIPERKNLRNNRIMLILYCAGQAIGISGLIYTRDLPWTTFQLAAAALCWCVWPWLFSASGEQANLPTPTEAQKAEVEKLWSGFRQVAMQKPVPANQSQVSAQSEPVL